MLTIEEREKIDKLQKKAKRARTNDSYYKASDELCKYLDALLDAGKINLFQRNTWTV